MKVINKLTTLVASGIVASAMTSPVMANADQVNVAYFLEWPTPNQVSKVEAAYDDALGVSVNWTNFDTGKQMTEAMLAGDIDIAYSQGTAPFIKAVNAGAPIKLVSIAVQYPANDCVVRNGAGINITNATELEGQSVAFPLQTMADYSFRMMMRELKVDVNKVNIIDQTSAEAAASLADGAVALACGFGGSPMTKMYQVGKKLMTAEQKEAAGIMSFDVVSVTEKFAQENPDLVKGFLKVTEEANLAFSKDQSKLPIIAKDAAMTPEATKSLMTYFHFPSNSEQLEEYLNEGGLADVAIEVVGNAYATKEKPALADYSVTIDTSFLK